ncbi:MAG TPA: sulfotransferase domain-containing protein, partial [Nocardioidaceae bacterium]|nr:sulfotransferase domain-containing protein [Nocardioidaceae bacterium]
VLLVHYDDLVDDLGGEMRRIADRLDVAVPEERWPGLVEAARFTSMRARADSLTPNTLGILKDPQAFFRAGRSGTGREVLTAEQLRRYHERAAALAPADLLTWLHRA